MQLTLHYRVKDKHAARLNRQAEAVNVVWNYCNDAQKHAVRFCRRWLSGYDLWKLVAGATKEGLDLHSHSAMRVCLAYAKSRQQHRKAWLRYRGQKALGWVPFNTGHVAFRDGAFVFRSERYDVFLHRRPPIGATFGAGSFNRDARGRWYLNLSVDVATSASRPAGEVGIDLGLTTLATCSDGTKIAMPAFYRATERRVGAAQRARKKRLVRTLHAKVGNQRRDYLHKLSTAVVQQNGLVVVGNVSASQLAKTRMAKSIHDAGWSDLRAMLRYKAMRHGGVFVEVGEFGTTQVCSNCGAVPDSRPKGIADLGIREWTCSGCGAVHDRDINSARNILRLGQQALAEGARP